MQDEPRAASGFRHNNNVTQETKTCIVRFTRDSRLNQKADFDRVFKEAHLRIRRGPLRALACQSPSQQSRLGLIVGRRFARRAVDRNRVKRQIREWFRIHARSLPPWDVVVQLVESPDDRDLGGPLRYIWGSLCEASSKACEPRSST